MPVDLATINKILKETYGFVTVEPQTLADCPYRAGTDEHKLWIKENIIQRQTNSDTLAYQTAVKTAENRLAKLKAQYDHVKVLDPDIDALVNNLPDVPVIRPAPTPHQLMIGRINKTWEDTGLGPVDDFVTYLPQILISPDYVTENELFKILRKASERNVEEVKQQYGIIFYAVSNRNWSLSNMNSMIYDQVQVQYYKYRR